MPHRRRLHATAATAAAVIAALAAALPISRPASAATASAAATGTTAPPGFVHAPGGPFLTDDQGRRLQFHGVNLVAKCGAHTSGNPCLPDAAADQPAYYLSPDATDPGRRFTDADAATLQSMGITLARVGIIWAGLEPGPAGVQADDPTYCSPHLPGTPYTAPDPYDAATVSAYLGHIDVIVDMLARHGIRTLVDMHQDVFGERFTNPAGSPPWKGEGAPLWATCTDGLPSTPTPTWQQEYATSPATSAAFAHLWANDVSGDLQGRLDEVWTAVARHFRGRSEVVGYDLFNEPFDPTIPLPAEFDRKLQCFYAGTRYAPASCAATTPPSQAPAVGLIPAVQAADPGHLEFYEAPLLTDFGAVDTVGVGEPLPFGNLVLDFHDYGFSVGSFDCTEPHCGPEEQATMQQFTAARALTRTAQPGGPAWLLSEWGAEDDPTDLTRVAALADSARVGWAYWAAKQFDDPTGSPDESLLDDAGAPRAKAPIIARPYPLATAGTPSSQSFDVSKHVFHLSYAPDPTVHAPTEIVVPVTTHYPTGYVTDVVGGQVTSPCNAAMLTVAAAPGAAAVDVTVRPGTCIGATTGSTAPAAIATGAGGRTTVASTGAADVALPDTRPGGPSGAIAAAAALLGVPAMARRRRRRASAVVSVRAAAPRRPPARC